MGGSKQFRSFESNVMRRSLCISYLVYWRYYARKGEPCRALVDRVDLCRAGILWAITLTV